MSTPELNPKALRAYAVYFVVHFATLFLPALLLQVVTGERSLAQLGMAVSWGWGLYRLTTRFYRGQGRIPTLPEARQLALFSALFSAVLVTAARGTAVFLLTMNATDAPQVSLALLLTIEFFVTALVNFLVLTVYLLPFVQQRAYDIWRQRNG